MLKQFGIVRLNSGRWRVVSLHGDGNVLESGVKIGDHPTLAEAEAKVKEYVASWSSIWPDDEVIVSSEG